MKSVERSLLLACAVTLGIAGGTAYAQNTYGNQTTTGSQTTTTYTEEQSDWDEFNRPGPYVGLGGSYMVSGFQDAAAKADFGDTLGFNVRGGYRLNEYWAFEGIYEYGDDFGSRRIPDGNIQTNSFTGNAKLILPLGRFQPYLEGGVGFLNANTDRSLRRGNLDVDGTNFAGRFGGGVDLYATKNIALYLDTAYTIPIKEVSDLYHFSFGWGAKYVF